MNVLFVSWDSPGTTSRESLLLPVFARLDGTGINVEMFQLASRFSAQSVLFPQAVSALVCHARQHAVDVFMPRGVVAAAITLLARRQLPATRVVYDSDRLVADERADFGGWNRHGPSYQLLRRIEGAGVLQADAVMVRTSQAKSIHLERGGAGLNATKFHVIPNAIDERLFYPAPAADRARTRLELGISRDAPVVVYAGSIGPQHRTDDMLRFYGELRRQAPTTRLLVLTRDVDLVAQAGSRAGLPAAALTVRNADAVDLPRYLAAADLGLAFRASCCSQQGLSPIKVAEYLLCGLPVLGSAGVGDLDSQIDPSVGSLLRDLSDDSLRRAAAWFLSDVLAHRTRYRCACRQRGVQLFGLTACASRYRAAFDGLTPGPSGLRRGA